MTVDSLLGAVVADPSRRDTVYSNLANVGTDVVPPYQPAFAARSDDAGLTWSFVMTPTARPPLRAYAVGTDPHEGMLLVGVGYGPKVPADRRYLSADEGR